MSARSFLPLLLGLALLNLACSGDGGAGTPRKLEVQILGLPDGASLVKLDDVRIEVGSDVTLGVPTSIHVRVTSQDGDSVRSQDTDTRVLVQGAALDIVHGHLRIGELDLGPVPAGSVVKISADGVTVDGGFRGVLPGLEPADD